ncbi:MAG TPA: VF530 family protein [Opitutaceae bacterium]|nr:VF530 family protein [Opitutaceae bacterium]
MTSPDSSVPPDRSHPKDPLHGVTLSEIVTVLHQRLGWNRLSELVPVRCFMFNPSVKSSLTFLRKTPWARARVESIYLGLLDKTPGSGDFPMNP